MMEFAEGWAQDSCQSPSPFWHMVVAHVIPSVAMVAYALLATFLLISFIEHLGYVSLRCQRSHKTDKGNGVLSPRTPTVCVQLPMFNEAAVATRAIAAACQLDWPRERLQIQVLDDSTDSAIRALVDDAIRTWRACNVNCCVIRREKRDGFKAGALEVGRKQTGAEFLALFDADFVPTPDFLRRVVPYFYDADSQPHENLALVQAQWSHLNPFESLLTFSQSLWVDDHHVPQMQWRSAIWDFVNFTGTAGVWRASAIEAAGGWRATSLVEDCELSFRVLFAGYRTVFVPVPVPAELPGSVTAYKAQQRRWTLGWAQLLRMHVGTLLYSYDCSSLKRFHLLYHMCLSIQWPLWCLWQLSMPFLVAVHGLDGWSLYFTPLLVYMAFSSFIAAFELADRYKARLDSWGLPAPLQFVVLVLRAVPSAMINSAMLPHQTCSWLDGMQSMNVEFETTPKRGSAPCESSKAIVDGGCSNERERLTRLVQRARVSRGYLVAELLYVAYHIAWALYFTLCGEQLSIVWSALFPGLAVAILCLFYGDDQATPCCVEHAKRLTSKLLGCCNPQT